MPYDVVDGEPSPHEVQPVTEIAREGLMHAIVERCITMRLVRFESTEGGEGTLPGFSGALGVMKLSVKAEGGHYTFIEVQTDQMGESRLDRNVKRFFVTLHKKEDPRHALDAAY